MNTSISIGGKLYDIGVRVILWNEKEGFNQYLENTSVLVEEDRKTGKTTRRVVRGKRYSKRPGGLSDIKQFVVHHSGGDGRNPSGMYETLHNQRGLSVHFAVEDDGRVYQFLDVQECAWHGGKLNRHSVGAECCLMPDAESKPDYYSEANCKKRGNLPHAVRLETIQCVCRKVFVMPGEQVSALARVVGMMWAVLEPTEKAPMFPRYSNGEIPREVLNPASKAIEHAGLIGHLHATAKKWDPAGFAWEMFEKDVAGWWEKFRGRR